VEIRWTDISADPLNPLISSVISLRSEDYIRSSEQKTIVAKDDEDVFIPKKVKIRFPYGRPHGARTSRDS
jgi:hypothetical protein